MFAWPRSLQNTVASLVAAIAILGEARRASADQPIAFERVAPLFQKHCHGCHGPKKANGDLRIDALNPDFLKGNDADHWRDVMDRLNFGDMPPAKEPALRKEDRELMASWIVQERRRADLAKNQAAHFRRLTRREYERTLQDLLGLPIQFGSKLPEDGRSKEGFRNDGDALRMSPLQYETYLQIADDSLAQAIVSGPTPLVHRYRLSIDEQNKDKIEALRKPEDRPGESFPYIGEKGKAFRIWNLSALAKEGGGTLAPSAIGRFDEAAVRLPERRFAFGMHMAFRSGETRLKVRAARVPSVDGTSDVRFPSLTVAIGSTNFHGVELAPIGEPIVIEHTDFRTYEYRVRMENVSVPNSAPLADRNAALVAAWNSATDIRGEKSPPRLKIEWIEFESPFLETWPPATHAKILFPNEGLSESAYAREVVRRFAERAYRGPVSPAELDRLMAYWAKARADSETNEQSLRETLGVVLSSPRFLGLPVSRASGTKARLTDHELASRLSYFLWSTMPDDSLRRLADAGKLGDRATLSGQVRRMIQDPKSWQLIEQFADQWLELDRLQRVAINKKIYPSFDDRLAAAMRLETLHFFGEVLRGDLSVLQFLDSDFTYVNERLAAHYDIPNVKGEDFRRVPLEKAHNRGGLLTHASILAANSDGRDGHPIKRGMWLLKNLFDEPPPPPPPNVPELNRDMPSLKGLTIPQALAVHRDNAACVGCHRKIDPWGIAFEEYDAIGRWQRDGDGAKGRSGRTKLPVAAKTDLPTGVSIDGMGELRAELLRSKSDDFRRALSRKLMGYALGRSLTLSDRESADALALRLRERGDRLSALVELVVLSEAFQSK